MKSNYFPSFLVTLICFTFSLQAQTWQAAKRYSAATGNLLSNTATAVSPDGSTYLVGSIRGTATLDNITVSLPAGITQSYLLKLNADFQAVWIQTFPQNAYCVTTDAQGNVFLAGAQQNGTFDSLTYVAKYDANGQILASFLSKGSGKSWARVLRTDAAGNCYVAGNKTGIVNFEPYSITFTGGSDCYVAKLSPDLSTVSWAVPTGSSSSTDRLSDLEIDNNGNVYTSGNYQQSGFFSLSGDFFVEKRSATNGLLLWQKIYYDGSGTSTDQFLALDPSGQSVYTAASFKHTVLISPGNTLTAENGTDDYHIFMTKLDASGNNIDWWHKISFTGDAYPFGMVWGDDGLCLHGYFVSTMLMGSTILTPQGRDPFFAKVAPADGAVQNAEKFAGNGTESGLGIDASSGSLVVSGNALGSTFSIGNFSLPGSSSSFYVARQLFNPPLNILVSDHTSVSCHGGSDGSISIVVSGGVPPYNYLWNNGLTTPTISGLAAGTYTVTASDSTGFQATATVVVEQPAALEIQVTALENTGCASQPDGSISVGASGGTAPYTYSWSNNAVGPVAENLTAGTYTVTATDAHNCSQILQSTVSAAFDFPPAAAFTYVSNGLDVVFSNISSDATGYLWNFGDSQTSTSPAPAHLYTDAGAYTVTLIAENGCGTDTFTQIIVIEPLGMAPVTDFVADKMVVCVGDTVHFTSLTANGNSFSWWFPGAEPTTSMLENPAVVYTLPGKHVVALTSSNPFGSDNETKTEFITVIDLPDAAYDFTSDGQTVIFTNLSQNSDSFMWDFGDGDTSTLANPTHTYAVPGIYNVTLTAFNQCGASTLQLVSSEEPEELEGIRLFPNPNRGIFSLEMSEQLKAEIHCALFSRDGQLLREETIAPENGIFNRTFRYDDLPPGIYLFRLTTGGKSSCIKVAVQE